MERLPDELARQAVTHASWVEERSAAYERLAFLGDSVLGLAITTHLYPRLESYGAGRLTKVRAQAVPAARAGRSPSGWGSPERLRTAAPDEFAGPATEALAQTERVLASVIEAVIGACYSSSATSRRPRRWWRLHAGDRAGAGAARGLQVGAAGAAGAARGGRRLRRDRRGGPAARAALRGGGRRGGRGARARRRPLEEGRRAGGGGAGPRRPGAGEVHLRSIAPQGLQVVPGPTRLEFAPGVSVVVGPNGSGKSNITDAVLWAMGEQSPLAVRGQSMQDVIFAGAHGVQARSEAEVEVVLDNTSGAVDLPAGEISIVRKLNRAGRASTASTARGAG